MIVIVIYIFRGDFSNSRYTFLGDFSGRRYTFRGEFANNEHEMGLHASVSVFF